MNEEENKSRFEKVTEWFMDHYILQIVMGAGLLVNLALLYLTIKHK